MKKRLLHLLKQPRYGVALIAGLLLALAFPNLGVAGFAWVAPGLLLMTALGQAPGRSFRLGYTGGLAYALLAFCWLLNIPFPSGALTGWIALSAYAALYTGCWTWLCTKLFRAIPVPGGAEVTDFASRSWAQRNRWYVMCALVWVALEMVMARLFTGFPWNFIGVSQFKMLPLIQVAAWTGVYGVSFLVVWFSVALGGTGLLLLRAPGTRRQRHLGAELVLPFLVVAAVSAQGYVRLMKPEPPRPTLRAALVQPSIPQVLIWDPRESTNRFVQLLDLSRRALQEKPDLLVWPEAALPSFSPENFQALTNLVATHPVWMLFGADDAQRRSPDSEVLDFFNSAFLFDPTGQYAATYRKRRLVIFGEYIPLVKWFPFMKYLTPIEGGFAQGKGPVPFRLTHPRANLSVLICFEDVFPHHTTEYVQEDTDMLVNLTNDGWFGEGSAQWQQGANALFRAVENNVVLVRCTNNGLTCWIDGQGRIRQVFRDTRGGIHGPGYLLAEIPLLQPGEKRVPTYYNRHGDRFGWGCTLAAGGLLLWSLRRGRGHVTSAL